MSDKLKVFDIGNGNEYYVHNSLEEFIAYCQETGKDTSNIKELPEREWARTAVSEDGINIKDIFIMYEDELNPGDLIFSEEEEYYYGQ